MRTEVRRAEELNMGEGWVAVYYAGGEQKTAHFRHRQDAEVFLAARAGRDSRFRTRVLFYFFFVLFVLCGVLWLWWAITSTDKHNKEAEEHRRHMGAGHRADGHAGITDPSWPSRS